MSWRVGVAVDQCLAQDPCPDPDRSTLLEDLRDAAQSLKEGGCPGPEYPGMRRLSLVGGGA